MVEGALSADEVVALTTAADDIWQGNPTSFRTVIETTTLPDSGDPEGPCRFWPGRVMPFSRPPVVARPQPQSVADCAPGLIYGYGYWWLSTKGTMTIRPELLAACAPSSCWGSATNANGFFSGRGCASEGWLKEQGRGCGRRLGGGAIPGRTAARKRSLSTKKGSGGSVIAGDGHHTLQR